MLFGSHWLKPVTKGFQRYCEQYRIMIRGVVVLFVVVFCSSCQRDFDAVVGSSSPVLTRQHIVIHHNKRSAEEQEMKTE